MRRLRVGRLGTGTAPSWPARSSCATACPGANCSSPLRPSPAVFRYFQTFPLNNPPPALAFRRALEPRGDLPAAVNVSTRGARLTDFEELVQ